MTDRLDSADVPSKGATAPSPLDPPLPAKHSSVKQANEMTLKHRSEVQVPLKGPAEEMELLLAGGGQHKPPLNEPNEKREEQQDEQGAHAHFAGPARSGGGSDANHNEGAAWAATRLVAQSSDDAMTQYSGGGGGGGDNHRPTVEHSQLEAQKLPADHLQQGGNNNDGTTVVPAATSLNAAATTMPATAKAPATRLAAGAGNPGPGQLDGDSVYDGPKAWRLLVHHWTTISVQLTLLIVFVLLWTIFYINLPEYALPSTAITRIALLFVGAQVAGILVTFIRLPDMLGMLFFGVLYTNVGLADFSGYQKLEAFLRGLALINIMLLAGLGLDAAAFKKLWAMILRLTLVPTIAEVIVIMLLAHWTLAMPWLWGLLLGLVITAVSPNVVVTVMLKLKEERLGLNSGIHTLIYAMTSCNDVVAIFFFGIVLGVIFSTGTLTEEILQGPIGIGIGIVFGYVYGLMLLYMPSRKSDYVNGLRFVLTILGGTIAVMGSQAIGYPSAGALGCMTIAFTAGTGWKRQQLKLNVQQQQQYANSSVSRRLDVLWKFLKPVSFALIGKEINFAVLDGRVVGYGALLLLLGSLFRLAFAYISTYGGNLSRKERAYITISGFPKATVQAALGPIALDLARSLSADATQLALANNVLVISALAIIFTAPLGAVLMVRLAPLCLQRSTADADDNDDDASRLDTSKNAQNLGVEGGRLQGGETSVAAYMDGVVLELDTAADGGRTKAARHLV